MAGVSRLLGITAALVLAGVIVATALAAPGDPKLVVKPADTAYARTIVLHKAELANTGWTDKATDFGRVGRRDGYGR